MSRMSRVMLGLGIAFAGAGYLHPQAARLRDAGPPTPRLQLVTSHKENSQTRTSQAQAVTSQGQPSDTVPSPAAPRAVLDTYCVTCHNTPRHTAGLMLDRMDVEHVGAGAEVWEKVVKKLRAGAMPPPNMPRPDKATYAAVASYLETELDRAFAAKPNPGRPTAHRLNRAEYVNVIRDLLAVEIDGRSLLPADDAGYGFDNVADLLSVSPSLLDRYMSAAQRISRVAVGDPAIHPAVETYRQPLDLLQNDRMNEDLPFGSRGGMAIRHNFPLDAEYSLKIRLQRHWENIIRGLGEPNQIDVFLDGQRIRQFTVGGKYPRGGRGQVTPEQEQYEQEADFGMEFRVPVKAGPHLVAVTFPRSVAEPEGVGPSRMPGKSFSFAIQTYDVKMGVESIAISGPFNGKAPVDETPSRRQIFVCGRSGAGSPRVINEDACATRILAQLARRAYRRPVTDAEVQGLLAFYRTGLKEGGFERGIEWALEKILVSPDFLFRVERDQANVAPGAPYRLSDLELASRVSFFLWSSIPDDELLNVAIRGRLKDPKVLEQQVRRMLADGRAKAVTNNFGSQWMQVRNMRASTPDSGMFPEFDESLRAAFQRETDLFFESQLREDRGVLELLTADYTFANERLARFYGIPDVYGNHFRRVTWPDDRRAGLLGQGSILTVTSYANRTSPVLRGKFLLENLLGAPPPPPPPNVPPLKENEEVPTTVRARLEQHRRNPVCATCHSRMDPLGFALENFDAIGQWRTIDGVAPVDSSGVLLDGTKFDGPAAFRKALLSHGEEFVGTVLEKLMTYALGRGVEYYDMPTVRKIRREAAPDYRWSSLILGIVKSTPFQMRTAQEQGPVKNTSAQRSE